METQTETETVPAKQTTLSSPVIAPYLEWPCHRDGLYRDLRGSHPGRLKKGELQISEG